ncbi:MAG TPA: ABC transporter ATP-binding protein [Fibrobacteria bacterium]|nr:ABC transporter ATP-binding protein [Fibrobacteria bacterium]
MIEMKNLGKIYRVGSVDFHALRGLDLAIAKGSFVAVVGKSGSGKSTLANLVAGIDRPTSGSIRVDGCDLSGLDEDGLARWRGGKVGVVFQSFQLLPTLTVLENVMLPLDFAGVAPGQAKLKAMDLLAKVGIQDQVHKLPLSLSGGQQQRVAIARSLANDPALVVADEPTGNLDTRTADEVLDLFSSCADQGRTIVLVTHERDLSSRVDRVVTLRDGRVESDVAGGRARKGDEK